ncbi:MAG: PHB depolymerase family esterase [Armatimonadota bacterium]|nr:PHB depolymerase family esterase [Armatimonadota bacterium]MDR7451009.1 PHB depolymerase family esterase [Armatimonadota bacterium]MDR7465970.1 PHB depolymerase family esterase [Armatimonadota bacterium]MDR7494035.1 PHB depolymerase family esterase [Armatimonadota bacterium]MDR7498485.1 PHB depolymerase family esterase [Armatimonadota bacterium]
MRRAGIVLGTSLLAALALLARPPLLPPATGASVSRTIDIGGVRRTFLLYVPPALPAGRAVPLVFVLHGGGGTGRRMERFGFNVLADRHGFLVVYPDAWERNWNDGRGDPHIRAQAEGIDDVGFIAALITRLSTEYPVDPRRVFSTGISNGGFMSQLLAARLSSRLAAIAPVAAGMAPAVAASLHPERPVSVLVINGTDDPLVPYEGGPVARNRGETISTEEIIRKWAAANRCPGPPEVSALPETAPTDGTRVKRTAYTACAEQTAVVLYTIEGGGHTWPGGPQYLPRAIVGRVSREINATEVIWQFFAAHPRP